MSKYSPDILTPTKNFEDTRFFPFILDKNPFPVGSFGSQEERVSGRIHPDDPNIPERPFSKELRKKEIQELNHYIDLLTSSRSSGVVWLSGNPGVGKTALLENYFGKDLMDGALKKRSLHWYITYDRHEDVRFLDNPNKYILQGIYKNLYTDHAEKHIFHDAITGALYQFLLSDEKFSTYSGYLTSSFSASEFSAFKTHIEGEGANFFFDLLNGADDITLKKIEILVNTLVKSRTLKVDDDFYHGFLHPFLQSKFSAEYLSSAEKFFNPREVLKQESVLTNTIGMLTSGAFSHFFLVLDQVDVAWNQSQRAFVRKAKFFNYISSIFRQLHGSGFILVLAVTEEAKSDIDKFLETANPDARRVLGDKNFITIPRVKNHAEVQVVLLEYLSKNEYRQAHTDELQKMTDEEGLADGLFPFDSTACEELFEISSLTIHDILEKAYICMNEAVTEVTNSEDKRPIIIDSNFVKKVIKKPKKGLRQQSK